MPCRFSIFRLAIGILWALALAWPAPSSAWNATGHRLTVAVAWPELSAPVRKKLEAILDAHPEAARWAAIRRAAWPGGRLAEAAVWPDEIRRTERRRAERENAPIDDERAHRDWHYLDWPVGEPVSAARGGQIGRQIARLSRVVADAAAPAVERAEALAWLAHLVGDAHMPLHVATWRDEDGQWTAGGNRVEVIDPERRDDPATNLHRFWDELPGASSLHGNRFQERAAALRRNLPSGSAVGAGEIDAWVAESHRIAATMLPPPGQRPWEIAEAYRARAKEIADRRVALAGARLAALLEALLSP